LEIQLGYQHRGIEPMMCGRDLKRSVLLSESVAGDTSIGHSIAFCEVIESLSGCMISSRAQALRAVALSWSAWRIMLVIWGARNGCRLFTNKRLFRSDAGDYLNLLLALTGNRFGKGMCRPGGVLLMLTRPWLRISVASLNIQERI